MKGKTKAILGFYLTKRIEKEPKSISLQNHVIIPWRHRYFTFKRQKLQKEQTKIDGTFHRRRKCEGSSPNSLRPISYFGSIWELYVLDLKTKVFCRKKNQLHFPMEKGLTVTK